MYQVYPASFNCGKPTSKTNGWGDVAGIIDKVPYLKCLGVDIVWLSPSELDQFCLGRSYNMNHPHASISYFANMNLDYTPLFVLMLCLHEVYEL